MNNEIQFEINAVENLGNTDFFRELANIELALVGGGDVVVVGM
jgi:hypothetical protein